MQTGLVKESEKQAGKRAQGFISPTEYLLKTILFGEKATMRLYISIPVSLRKEQLQKKYYL